MGAPKMASNTDDDLDQALEVVHTHSLQLHGTIGLRLCTNFIAAKIRDDFEHLQCHIKISRGSSSDTVSLMR